MKRSATQEGTVSAFRKNHHDDIDGLMLEGGFEIRFPPHVGHKVADVISVGDTIEFQGGEKTRPKGETVFEAEFIRCGDAKIQVDHPHKKTPHKDGHVSESPMTASGRIHEFHRNKHHDVDGFQLEDGTEVKFPPHLAARMTDIMSVGDTVNVKGRRHQTPKGDIHLHADSIVNSKTRKSVSRHEESEPLMADLMRELKAIRKIVESWQA